MIDDNKNKNVKNDNDDTDKYESVGKGSNPGSKSKNDLKIVDLEESGGNVEISSEGEQTDIHGAGGGQGEGLAEEKKKKGDSPPPRANGAVCTDPPGEIERDDTG